MMRLERFQEKCEALARCRYQLRSEPRPEKKQGHLRALAKHKGALVLCAALALLCVGTPAEAALKLCNRTSYILYAATASIRNTQARNPAETQGWTRIAPGDCQVARAEDLTAQTYLVHARSSLAHGGPAKAWGGNFPMCVEDTNFHLDQSVTMAACRNDAFALPFAALNTGGRRSWTMTLDESPALPSLLAAQLAGVKRLLRDNGYAVGAIDGSPDKKTGIALTAFRKRMNFPERAGNAELFAALEKQALKTNAPAGYTICNDSKAMLEAALAQTEAGHSGSRGWWMVPPGACARAITTPLGKAAYYLFARRKDGKAIVSGPDKFCIAPTRFESHARGNCAARGQAEAGFRHTATAGLAGTVAHISDQGLVPAGAPAKP
jgi:uncharacterized membrane protein